MILHTVNKSPHTSNCLQSCLRTLSDQDALLLIEDGVYAADNHYANQTEALGEEITLYVLKADVDARGLQNRLSSRFQVIDDAAFVDLCVQYPKTQSWY
ncbi:MAG: sulfurtransferase complex subunit TusB [Motiliproteus sp.]|nr:sulfurtransferase complex subunit TusB [Motiliproteus sp.]MCW9053912.1 sulfurtransferase complex subunit TusB [Motiliproteus sp.]